MGKTLFLIFISVVLSACCTKKDCSNPEEPDFSLQVIGLNKEVTVERFFAERSESKKTYFVSKDTVLKFSISNSSSELESFVISIDDSEIVLDDFEVDVTGVEEIECNKCFLKKEERDIVNISEFKSDGVVQKQGYFEISFR